MAESRAYQRLRGQFKNALWERYENSVGTGTPDTWCLLNKHLSWVENKEGRILKDGAFKLVKPVRASQQAWHTKYAKHGGESFFAIWMPQLDEVWFIEGVHYSLLDGTHEADEVQFFHRNPEACLNHERIGLRVTNLPKIPTDSLFRKKAKI